MDELFFIGEVDQRNSEICMKSTYVNYTFLLLVGVLILTQVLCSVLYITRRVPEVEQEDMQAGVLVMVPCYNESEKELGKTIESVLLNDYPEDNKILMVIADGVITGRGEEMSCPETIGKILGFDFDPMDEAFHYKSIGKKTDNYASVYAGNYEKLGKKLKYVVIIKQGTPEERGTGRAGNRGKRDSQLLLFGILNRLQYHREPRAFDRKLTETFQGSGLPLHEIEYLMAIDADTRVSDNAIKSLIYNMEKNKKILACCGETRVDNKTQSWVTMMQVYEYYSAHHTKKAFESIFGCVTCLPGCFTLYRMYTEELEPLLVNDTIFQGYSRNDVSSLHERNLFELGEDRMLTTLLLQTFSGMNLSFVPEATCWTIVPHTFAILVSQRRRWINSTLHNMLELLKVKTMCGVCLCSMKTVVVFDLISTFVLPSGLIYLYYLIISSILNPSHIDPFVIFGLCSYGLMTVCFILRQEYEFFWWFTVYMIAGLPVFYFYLPIYSFLNMDDLSWGKTREIKAKPETVKKTIPSGSLDFSEKDIQEANYAKNTNRKEIKMNQNKKTSDQSLRSSSRTPHKVKRNKKKEYDDSIPSPPLLEVSADTDANSSLCSKIMQENFSANNSDGQSKGHIQNLERVHEENSAITEDLAKVIEREAHTKGPMTTSRCDPPGKRKVKKKRKAKAGVNDKPESKEKKYPAAELEWEELEWEVTLQRLSQKMEGCWPEGFASPKKEDP